MVEISDLYRKMALVSTESGKVNDCFYLFFYRKHYIF